MTYSFRGGGLYSNSSHVTIRVAIISIKSLGE